MKLFNYKEIGPGMFLYLYWLKKHHLTHPRKPMYGFEGFDTIILYVQLSASSKICWQLDQLSIIDPISCKTFILVSNIHGAWVIYRIQDWQIDFLSPLISWIYHLEFDSVCHPLLNQFSWRKVKPVSFFWPPSCYWKPLTAFSLALLVLSLEGAAVVAPWQNILKRNIKATVLNVQKLGS